jgi:thioesterase domain-containing protein
MATTRSLLSTHEAIRHPYGSYTQESARCLSFWVSQSSSDRPVHALRARGFNPGEPFFSSISDCVATYADAIKEKQPQGPYALAGYSYGSMLAFEIAKVLNAAGHEVRFLGCLNLPPHIRHRMRQLDWHNCLLHLSFFLDIVTEDFAHEIAPRVHSLRPAEAIAYILSVASRPRVEELSLTAEKLNHWSRLAYGL